MPSRTNVFERGKYYHIYNRGIARGTIFFNHGNYEHCLRLMKRYHKTYGVALIAYCLMPNHYHFLLRQETEQPLSRFISVLFNAYAQAVNRQQGRSGALFQGRFQHVAVDDEAYVVQLARYIHLNPVRAQLVGQPEDWMYSNYLEWVGRRAGTLKDAHFIKHYFAAPEAYQAYVTAHLNLPEVNPDTLSGA